MSALSVYRLYTLLLSAFCAALLATLIYRSSTFAEGDQAQVEVVLSQLPPKGSARYAALRRIASRAAMRPLEMTKSEVWSVAEAKLPALLEAAARQGVAVARADAAKQMMKPMGSNAAMTESQSAMMSRTMQMRSVMGMEMVALPPPSLMEYELTKGAKDAAAGAPPSITIPLNATTTIVAQRTSIARSGDAYVWRGVVQGTDQTVTLLWWPSGRLSGTINFRDHVYAIKNVGSGMHAVVEIAPQMLPDEHAPAPTYMLEEMHMTQDPLVTQGDASMLRPARKEEPQHTKDRPKRDQTKDLEDSIDGKLQSTPKAKPPIKQSRPTDAKHRAKDITITLIVAYTKQAASYYGSIEHDLIAVATEEANQSFRNSGLGNIHLELTHAYQTDYVESGGHFDHVWRFADKGDGYMDEIHALREKYRADIGVLLVHDPAGCGLATRVGADADEAFAVVHHECAALTYSIAHEVGHILGARHDQALDQNVHPFPYGHGFVNGTEWRTMMSYKNSCNGCPRLPVWSGPDTKIKAVPAGNELTNNARVIAEQAARVAGFKDRLGRGAALVAPEADARVPQ